MLGTLRPSPGVPPSENRTRDAEWGVTCEGFASPLNATLGQFFSAFADVDESGEST